MQVFRDKENKIIACLLNNAIVTVNRSAVMGIVLGNCVYGKNACFAGKLFKEKLRDKNGHIVALVDHVGLPSSRVFNTAALTKQSWDIAIAVKDHNCPWVEENDTWSLEMIEDVLVCDGMIFSIAT